MHKLPDRSVVLGSGAGALTVAADLALLGLRVTVADFPKFSAGLEAVQEVGGVRVRCPWHGVAFAPIAETSTDPAAAAQNVPLVIVSVPSFGHMAFAEALAPVLTDEQVVIWVGEGGGSLAAAAALHQIGRRPGVFLGETNTLPYGTRIVAPATIGAEKKIGGTLVAALPGDAPVYEVASQIWPWVSKADNVWETVLTNLNAIDHVPPLLCNLGTIQGRTGKMLLWGEGATPGVARVIEVVDAEMLSLKKVLNVSSTSRYVDYLVSQGLVDRMRDDLYTTLQASGLSNGTFLCGPEALQSRYMTEDVPFGLVLASSIGQQIGVATPVIDGLIAIASAATGTDWRAEGRTLASWGLGDADREELLRIAKEGWW